MRILGLILGKDEEITAFPKCPELFQDPLKLLYNE
jgi:hypothetical protein